MASLRLSPLSSLSALLLLVVLALFLTGATAAADSDASIDGGEQQPRDALRIRELDFKCECKKERKRGLDSSFDDADLLSVPEASALTQAAAAASTDDETSPEEDDKERQFELTCRCKSLEREQQQKHKGPDSPIAVAEDGSATIPEATTDGSHQRHHKHHRHHHKRDHRFNPYSEQATTM
jgi:hypothetical protein